MTRRQTIRIGTRGSPLALFQARLIASQLAAVTNDALQGEIVTFTTKGDKLVSERLINSGGKGLFTREIDHAVDEGEVDIGVHSLKDVPTQLPDGQEILTFPERADVRDGLLTSNGITRLIDLPEGATLGTASLRREAQALALRPDLKVIAFRGNVQTRLKKLEDGLADATFLAMAGLERLGLENLAYPIPIDHMMPAAGQGIIAVAARPAKISETLREALETIDDKPTRCAAIAERAFLTELDGSCRTAIAAHMCNNNGEWHLRGEVLSPDGKARWTAQGTAKLSASHEELAELGRLLGRSIRNDAGGQLPAYTDA